MLLSLRIWSRIWKKTRVYIVETFGRMLLSPQKIPQRLWEWGSWRALFYSWWPIWISITGLLAFPAGFLLINSHLLKMKHVKVREQNPLHFSYRLQPRVKALTTRHTLRISQGPLVIAKAYASLKEVSNLLTVNPVRRRHTLPLRIL